MPEAKTDIDRHNQTRLAEVSRMLQFSQGEFSLIFAVCNSTQQRIQLAATLQANCPVAVKQLRLEQTIETLFSTIRKTLGAEQPDALMVFGLEGVDNLAQVLIATNQIREEFRSFGFPIVLWLTDDMLRRLIRIAPDFYSWGNTVEFETPTQAFLDFLADLTDSVWSRLAEAHENELLNLAVLRLLPGSPRHIELYNALEALKKRQVSLPPPLAAQVEFLLGRVENNNDEAARRHYELSLALWQSLVAASAPSPDQSRWGLSSLQQQEAQQDWREYMGITQFYLGLWWRNHSERALRQRQASCHQAEQFFRQAVETLEAAGATAWAEKFVNYWAEILHRLENWAQLETVAKKALVLHQGQQNGFRAARTWHFLAEVALARGDAVVAHNHVQRALSLLETAKVALPMPRSKADRAFLLWEDRFHRSWYLFSLGKVQQQLHRLPEAINTLNQARSSATADYDPWLYSGILRTLQNCYFAAGKYLESFMARQERESVESRFGFRAFVGAGRLQPKQKIANPALPAGEPSETLIAASGRRQDIEKLTQQLALDGTRVMVIYGPSGVGKSSLIEAGLVPALQNTRFETRKVVPVLLRVYQDWCSSFASKLSEALLPFVSPAVDAPDPEGTAPALTDLPSQGAQIMGLLEKLRENHVANRVTVLILDQFEEFFFEHEKAEERRHFYHFLSNCLKIPYVKIVFSLREDYIHLLLEINRIAPLEATEDNILDKRIIYHLGNFNQAEARTVIQDLTDPTPYAPEPDLIDQVVNDLSDASGEVRPIELQIVGAQLQKENIRTASAYAQKGNPPKAYFVRRYLASVVKACGPSENQKVADLLLYMLTDEKGIRPLKTREDLERDLQVFQDKIKQSPETVGLVLEILTKSRLVVHVPETPEDLYRLDDSFAELSTEALPPLPEKQYQLVHDYIATFIRDSHASEMKELVRQLEDERRKRDEERRHRREAELKSSRVMTVASVAAFGVGAMVSVYLWQAKQSDKTQAINAEFERRSVAMRSYLDSGLNLDAMLEAVQTGADLTSHPDRSLLKESTRLQTLAAIRHVVDGTGEIAHLLDHAATVYVVEFSPDGRWLASTDGNGEVKLWQADRQRSGKAVWKSQLTPARSLTHGDTVYGLAFSPDSTTVVTGSQEGQISVWDLATGLPRTRFANGGETLWSIAISPDGQTLATSDKDGKIRLWMPDGSLIRTIEAHQKTVSRVIFSPDGTLLASTSEDGTVKLWTLQGDLRWELPGVPKRDYMQNLAFSPKGDALAGGGRGGSILLWNPQTGELIRSFQAHTSRIYGLAFSPDGQQLASSSQDNTIRLWSRNGRELRVLQGHTDSVFGIVFSPDGQFIASGSEDQTVKIWSVADKVLALQHTPPAAQAAFNPEGTLVATVGGDGVVRLWSYPNGIPQRLLQGHTMPVYSVAFSQNGQQIATAGEEGTARLWDLSGKTLAVFDGHEQAIYSLAMDPREQLLVTGSADGTVKLWDMTQRGQVTQPLRVIPDQTPGVALSPNGALLATGSDSTIHIRNRQGDLLYSLRGHKGPVYGLAFSPQGDRLASSSGDNTIKLWNLTTRRESHTLKGHSAESYRLEFSPDGQMLLSASLDNTVRLWHREGESLYTARFEPAQQVWTATFSPDGETVATASRDGLIKFWNFDLDRLVPAGCEWLSPYLAERTPEALSSVSVCLEGNPDLAGKAALALLVQAKDEVENDNVEKAQAMVEEVLALSRHYRFAGEAQQNLSEARTALRQQALSQAIASLEVAFKTLERDGFGHHVKGNGSDRSGWMSTLLFWRRP